MIISRTPYRVSFFGGGTDYPAWFGKHGGAVLSTAIDKYCYITCRQLPPFFAHRSRIVWSHIELVNDNSEIEHPAVEGCLRHLEVDYGVEIQHSGDLPARSGIGSSSSFTVGLLNCLHTMRGRDLSVRELAKESIYLEHVVMGETVGIQDQIAAAYGGLNRIEFAPDGGFDVHPLQLSMNRLEAFQGHLMMFFTGLSRTASTIAQAYVGDLEAKAQTLHTMRGMVDTATRILTDRDSSLSDFGSLLHESWQLKRKISDRISTPEIDKLYSRAREAGALGGKLCGAGGGGFLLLFVAPSQRESVRSGLNELIEIPIAVSSTGTTIITRPPQVTLA
ncbi:MAG TPA: kinase [Lentisphaeria bacterium]|nr:kinase [Lentisphaeria bacterium]